MNTLKIFSDWHFLKIIIILIIFSVPVSAHDVHISYCQATLDGNILKGKVTYYRDDFEKALMNWTGNKKLPGDAHWQAKVKFLKEKFRATSEGKQITLEITGSGVHDSSIWFDFAFKSPEPITKLNIEHTTLFKEYNDQMNLIGIKTGTKEFSHICTPSKRVMSLQL
jgi:hypothetical protein